MVSFNESSYETMEGGAIDVLIMLSQPSSMEIQVEINSMDVNATGTYVTIFYI